MFNFTKRHYIEAISIAFLLLFLLWGMGYLCNGILGTKFELNSVWSGFQALSGAGFIAAIKYLADSKFNSKEGEGPYINANINVSTGNKKQQQGDSGEELEPQDK